METGWGHLVGSVEHLEGKGRKSDVAIPRFLCGNPCFVSVKDRGIGTHEQVLNVQIACR
jgi:hypothetical protein